MDSLKRDEQKLLEVGKTPANEFAENARDAFLQSLVQMPLTGATQLVDKAIGTELVSKVQIFSGPKPAEFGTPGWAGQIAGGTLGSALPFIALHRMMGPGAAASLETSANYGLGRAALPHLGKSALVGGLYSSILVPVDTSTPEKEADFWAARLRNGATGSLTGITLTATAIGLKSTGVRALNHDIVAGGLSGIPAGLVSANAHSLMEGKGFAKPKDMAQQVATFTLGGAFLGGSNMVHEHIFPTSGIRGVRTVEDMSKLADTTRTPDYAQRNALLLAEEVAGRPYAMLPGKPNQVANAVLKSLEGSTLPAAQKRLVADSHQDLLTSLEAINGTGYKVTVYGSARIGPERFEYQRCRWFSGELAKNDITVMTGGGVDRNVRRGIMDAGNRGAFEAGGKSIGVSIELPFEGGANPFQTIKLTHQNYSTRKEVLRKANAYVIEEGGLGTVDEAMELLCNLQCRKQDAGPVFFIGTKTYGPLVKALDNLVNRGLMSPGDMKLFRVVDDPNIALQAILKHKAAWEAANAPAAGGLRVTFPGVPSEVTGLKPSGG